MRMRSLVASASALLALSASVACSQEKAGIDPSVSSLLPAAPAIEALPAFGGAEVWTPAESEVTPLDPSRSVVAGRRTYFVASGPDQLPMQIDVLLYRSESPSEARGLWREEGLAVAYAEISTNFVDRDPEEIEARLDTWRFEIDGVDDGTGMCLGGWNARGLEGCHGPNFWAVFCSWTVDIGLALTRELEIDVREAFREIEHLVRHQVGC